jgi:2-polyprenyl-6-methoxyphenol hydroxylase-like FAD-dependent oxidoreductase
VAAGTYSLLKKLTAAQSAATTAASAPYESVDALEFCNDIVDETFVWWVFERAPLARWSVGRVMLLGDACHAMQPHMGKGRPKR